MYTTEKTTYTTTSIRMAPQRGPAMQRQQNHLLIGTDILIPCTRSDNAMAEGKCFLVPREQDA